MTGCYTRWTLYQRLVPRNELLFLVYWTLVPSDMWFTIFLQNLFCNLTVMLSHSYAHLFQVLLNFNFLRGQVLMQLCLAILQTKLFPNFNLTLVVFKESCETRSNQNLNGYRPSWPSCQSITRRLDSMVRFDNRLIQAITPVSHQKRHQMS